jgi:ribokinase
MKTGKILVVGSSNTDMVVRADHFPAPGETILGGEFLMNAGGKGANQAVAAARLGGDVIFIGKTGNDIFGKQAVRQLAGEGVDVSLMAIDPEKPSGIALITVDRKGENSIVVASGANGTFSPQDFDKALPVLEEAEYVLLQLEIPLETVEYVAGMASSKGNKVILNPAPAFHLPDKLLSDLFLITPNESEATILTGIPVNDQKSAEEAASSLLAKGVKMVIITLGAAGAFYMTNEKSGLIPAPRVDAVDTTAAGDTFSGALAVALSEGKSLEDSVVFANLAAAISVTRPGAQSSVPFRKELTV